MAFGHLAAPMSSGRLTAAMTSGRLAAPRRYLALWFPFLPAERLAWVQRETGGAPAEAPVVLAERGRGGSEGRRALGRATWSAASTRSRLA